MSKTRVSLETMIRNMKTSMSGWIIVMKQDMSFKSKLQPLKMQTKRREHSEIKAPLKTRTPHLVECWSWDSRMMTLERPISKMFQRILLERRRMVLTLLWPQDLTSSPKQAVKLLKPKMVYSSCRELTTSTLQSLCSTVQKLNITPRTSNKMAEKVFTVQEKLFQV